MAYIEGVEHAERSQPIKAPTEEAPTNQSLDRTITLWQPNRVFPHQRRTAQEPAKKETPEKQFCDLHGVKIKSNRDRGPRACLCGRCSDWLARTFLSHNVEHILEKSI